MGRSTIIGVLALCSCSFQGSPGGSLDSGTSSDGGADAASVDVSAVLDAAPGADARPLFAAHLNVGALPGAPDHVGVDFPGTFVPDGATCTGDGVTFTTSATAEIGGTEDDVLFRRNRFGATITCQLATGNGTFEVSTLFAEIFRADCGSSAQTRDIAIVIEGVEVDTLDVVASTNGCAIANPAATPFSRDHVVTVSDGQLDVVVTGDNGNPTAILSALSVVEQ